MSNIIYAAMIWMAMHGQPEDMRAATIVRNGETYVVEGWTANCPEPTLDQLRALQPQADAKAAEVAAQPQDVTLGKVTIRTHPDGSIEIVRPIIMAASTNGSPAYGLIVTPEGDLVTYLDHASPRPSPEETQRRIAEAVARKATAKAKALAEINGQLQQRIENLERLLGLRQ